MDKIRGHDIIVIGASLGGAEAIPRLIAQFPKDLPAAIFIVIHLSEGSGAFLLDRLKPVSPLKARLAHNCQPIRPGMCISPVRDFI